MMRFEEILALATLLTGVISLIFIKYKKPNKIIDTCKSFFPVLLIVFFLRSFLFEPFRIPSGSMKPTLLVGDFILVNKFDYGIRIPVLGLKVLDIGDPKTGDVVVFHGQDGKDLIKRVIGVPGDHIQYRDKQLFINGLPIPASYLNATSDHGNYAVAKLEQLDSMQHEIYVYPGIDRMYQHTDVVVPAGNYFVMGDNRDNSEDSRVFGFVKDQEIVGKAIATWMSWGDGVRWSRIGKSIYKQNND